MGTTLDLGVHTSSPVPDQIERGVPNTVEARFAFDGAPVVLTSGTCTVFDASNNTVATGVVTVGGEVGRAAFTFTPATTRSFSEGWRTEWEVTDGSRTYTMQNDAMLVRKRLACPVTMATVWLRAPALDPSGADPITAMTAQDQASMLTAAWLAIQVRVIEYGKRPYLVVGGSALHEVTLETTLFYIFEALAHRLAETYGPIAEAHRMRAEDAWKRVKLAYDETQDGTPDGRVAVKPSGIWVGRGRW